MELRELVVLVRELRSDISAAEYVNFNADIPASEHMINEHEIDWRQKVQEDWINAILNQNNVCEETQEISDDDDPLFEDDILEEKVSFAESLAMLKQNKINALFWMTSVVRCFQL